MPLGQPFRNSHLADGGYFDNDGVVSALEWLENNLEEGTVDAERILLIQIPAGERFVPPLPTDDRPVPKAGATLDAKPNGPSWLYTLAGPLLTVINSGGSGSQLARGPRDIQRFINHYTRDGERQGEAGDKPLTFMYCVFDLKGVDILSWQLSQSESNAITKHWQAKETQARLEKIETFLTARTLSPGDSSCQ
jgi:hypothetical protein